MLNAIGTVAIITLELIAVVLIAVGVYYLAPKVVDYVKWFIRFNFHK